MTDLNQCRHITRNCQKSFCSLCGCLLYKNSATLKPLKYYYRPEVNSLISLSSFRTEGVLTANSTSNYAYHLKRREIIKLLLDMVHKMKFKSLTFYLSLYYIDIIFSKNEIITCFELNSLSCLVLATKFCENDSIIPTLNHFLFISKLNYSVDDLKKNEIKCLQLLSYKLCYISSYQYTNLLLFNGIVFDDEVLRTKLLKEEDSPIVKSTQNSSYNSPSLDTNLNPEILEKFYSYVKEILLCFIQESKSCRYSTLDIACAVVAYSRSYFNLSNWNTKFDEVYNIKFENFSTCFYELTRVVKKNSILRINSLIQVNYNDSSRQINKLSSKEKVKSKTELCESISPVKESTSAEPTKKVQKNAIESPSKQKLGSSHKGKLLTKDNLNSIQIELFNLNKRNQTRENSKVKIKLLSDDDIEKDDLVDYHRLDTKGIKKTIQEIDLGSSFKETECFDHDTLMSKTKKIFLKSKNFLSKEQSKKENRLPNLTNIVVVQSTQASSYQSITAALKSNNVRNLSLIGRNVSFKAEKPLNIKQNIETLPTHFQYGKSGGKHNSSVLNMHISKSSYFHRKGECNRLDEVKTFNHISNYSLEKYSKDKKSSIDNDRYLHRKNYLHSQIASDSKNIRNFHQEIKLDHITNYMHKTSYYPSNFKKDH